MKKIMKKMTTKRKVQGAAAISMLCLIGTLGVCHAAPQEGWVKESSRGNGWYYYINGNKVYNSWAKSGNDWYYLGESGEMATNCFINNDDRYTIEAPDDNTAEWYYVGADGKMAKGWVEVQYRQNSPADARDKQWYYFGSSGVMYSSAWIQGAKSWYYVLENGVMLTDAVGPKLRNNGEYRYEQDNMFDYIYNKDGVLVTGWCQDKDTTDWYYCGADGVIYEDRWGYIGNKWYYLGKDGIMYDNETGKHYGKYGIAEVDGDEFCFSSSGAIMTGWVDVDDDRRVEKWHYFGTNGAHVVDKWSRVNGKWYYLGKTGEMVTGFLKRTGSGNAYVYEEISAPEAAASGVAYYYLNPKGGAMITGPLTLYAEDGRTVDREYYFDEDGVMVTEQVQYTTRGGARTYCYYGSDGKRVTDLKNTTIWKGSNGKYYPAETAANSADRVYATVDANGVIRLK